MGENKGKGTKGRNYDELTGVGTSSAGITGTTGNLNTGTRDGGIGMPAAGDSGNRAGNRQSADADDGDTTPALGRGNRSSPSRSRQGGQESQGSQGGQSQQSGQGGSKQSGSKQGDSKQGGQSAQGGLGRSLDQDVMGKEQ
jgi:hypothetical protein